jgi:hypothetical protein
LRLIINNCEFSFSSGSGLKCYQCNSFEHGLTKCGHGKDAVDPSFLDTCPPPPAPEFGSKPEDRVEQCRKIVTMIEFDVNNNTAINRITRKCGYITSKYDGECYYRGGFGGRQRVCSCNDKEGCNSAPAFGGGNGPLLAFWASVAVFFAIKKF